MTGRLLLATVPTNPCCVESGDSIALAATQFVR